MFIKQRGFAAVEILLVIVVVIVAAGISYRVYTSLQTPNLKVNLPALSKQDAFILLESAYDKKQKISQKECSTHQKECLDGILSEEDGRRIAKAYGVIIDDSDAVTLRLEKGSSVDIGGLGIAYVRNKEKLGIKDTEWYWGVTACATNNRIIINAESGVTSGVHPWVVCTKVNELSN